MQQVSNIFFVCIYHKHCHFLCADMLTESFNTKQFSLFSSFAIKLLLLTPRALAKHLKIKKKYIVIVLPLSLAYMIFRIPNISKVQIKGCIIPFENVNYALDIFSFRNTFFLQ